jgi:hypothetical protein
MPQSAVILGKKIRGFAFDACIPGAHLRSALPSALVSIFQNLFVIIAESSIAMFHRVTSVPLWLIATE